jgi:hypothetical protein
MITGLQDFAFAEKNSFNKGIHPLVIPVRKNSCNFAKIRRINLCNSWIKKTWIKKLNLKEYADD